jgi:hypothetical protein
LSDSGSGGVRFWEPILRQQIGADIRERFITRATELLSSLQASWPSGHLSRCSGRTPDPGPRAQSMTRTSGPPRRPQDSSPRSLAQRQAARVSQSWIKNAESDVEPDGHTARSLPNICGGLRSGTDVTSSTDQPILVPGGVSWTAQAMPGTADGREPNPDGSAPEWWHQRLAVLSPRSRSISRDIRSPRRRRSGVNRHSSSRPVGTGGRADGPADRYAIG